MPKTPKQILLDAAKVVECGWTKGAYARNTLGEPVTPSSPDAVSWCALGAIRKAGGEDIEADLQTNGPLYNKFCEAFSKAGIVNIPTWNDNREDGREVAEGFRRAAKKCQGD